MIKYEEPPKQKIEKQINENHKNLKDLGVEVDSEWETNCSICDTPCIVSHFHGKKLIVWCLQRGWWGAQVGCEYYCEGEKRKIPFESDEVSIGMIRYLRPRNPDIWGALRKRKEYDKEDM
jgi:hypothetical protein